MDNKLTPIMEKYKQLKLDFPADTILLYNTGFFYEIFFKDAELIAPILDLVLTKRGGVSMCGFSTRTLDTHLPLLTEAGIKIAIAEELANPQESKKKYNTIPILDDYIKNNSLEKVKQRGMTI